MHEKVWPDLGKPSPRSSGVLLLHWEEAAGCMPTIQIATQKECIQENNNQSMHKVVMRKCM